MSGLKSIYQVTLFLLCGLLACSANDELKLLNGPIVTHTTMHSVLVWLQTNTEVEYNSSIGNLVRLRRSGIRAL